MVFLGSISLATQFSFEELNIATDSFKTILGEGAYGKIYMGWNIQNSATCVAVKMLNEVAIPWCFGMLTICIIRSERRLCWTKCPSLMQK